MPVDSRVISGRIGFALYRIDYLQIFSLGTGSLERAQALPLRERGKRKVLHIKVASPKQDGGNVGPLSKRGNGLRSCGLSERGKRLKVCRTM